MLYTKHMHIVLIILELAFLLGIYFLVVANLKSEIKNLKETNKHLKQRISILEENKLYRDMHAGITKKYF